MQHIQGRGEGAYRVLVGKPKERDHLDDPGMDGRIILRWIFRNWNGGDIDWIVLAQDRDRLQALVNVVIRLQVP
jgi:hypothetical protein